MKKVKIERKLSLKKVTVNRLTDGLESIKGGSPPTNTLAACGSCCLSLCNTNYTCITR